MKQEIQEGKQILIEKIQSQLRNLRDKRRKMEAQKEQSMPYQLPFEPSINRNQYNELKRQTNEMAKVYQMKKELATLGMQVDNPNDIHIYQTDIKMKKKLENKRKNRAQQERKAKIIEQELEVTKQFLKKKTKNKNRIRQLQEFTYQFLFQKKRKDIAQYESFLKKSQLNKVEKQSIIDMTFDLLKQWNNLVKKIDMKNFLLANQIFSRKFRITNNEINRDLSVYSTKEQQYLDNYEFYEFITSVQITSKALKPNKKYLEKPHGNQIIGEENPKKDTQKQKMIQTKREMLKYFRKVFSFLDKKKQGVVERKQFLTIIQKGLYIRMTEMKNTKKDNLVSYSTFITEKTKNLRKHSYYKQLQVCYLTFTQIQAYLHDFFKQKIGKKGDEELSLEEPKQLEQEKQQNEFEDINQQNENETLKEQNEQKEGKQSNDFEWKKESQIIETKLEDLDNYYNEVRNKYGNEIEWNNRNQYKTDFQKLEFFIKQQEQKKLQK